MHTLRDLIALAHLPKDPPAENLLARIAELEEENTRLRRVEEASERNVRSFEALVRNSRDGILVVTPAMTVLRLIRSVVGSRESELLGQSVLSVTHPEDEEIVKELFSRLLSSDCGSVTGEFRIRTQAGGWAWIEAQLTDMLEVPDVQAIVVNCRETTQQRVHQKSAEMLDALRSSREYAIFSESLQGVILDWNAGAEVIFGYTAEEAVGRSTAMLWVSGQQGAAERILPVSCDAVGLRKNGQEVNVHLQLAPVCDGRGVMAAVSHLARIV
jgi:PAS domain S-box-containing protein